MCRWRWNCSKFQFAKNETIPNRPYSRGFSQVQSLLGVLRCLPQTGVRENRCAWTWYPQAHICQEPCRLHRLQKVHKDMSTRSNHRSQLMTDLLLIPAFIATAITGVGFYFAGFETPHEVWEQWATAHTVSGVLMAVLAILHVCQHWKWYKSLLTHSIGKKSCVTLCLSLAFFLLFITGLLLIIVIDGPNSWVGTSHFWIGLALIVLSLWHIIVRWKALVNMWNKR